MRIPDKYKTVFGSQSPKSGAGLQRENPGPGVAFFQDSGMLESGEDF